MQFQSHQQPPFAPPYATTPIDAGFQPHHQPYYSQQQQPAASYPYHPVPSYHQAKPEAPQKLTGAFVTVTRVLSIFCAVIFGISILCTGVGFVASTESKSMTILCVYLVSFIWYFIFNLMCSISCSSKRPEKILKAAIFAILAGNVIGFILMLLRRGELQRGAHK